MFLQGARNLNPAPYTAEYMGHKIHLDQNEKLVMFGATHVLAMDGFSGKIVAHSTMPVKNNLKIYGDVYRYYINRFVCIRICLLYRPRSSYSKMYHFFPLFG